MKIFDSHCHLDDRSFNKDFQDVLQRAVKAGVYRMLIAGVNEKTSARAVVLASQHANLFASIGVHPHDAQSCTEQILANLGKLAASAKVVAWGEIGLDFNRMYSPQADQEKWFIRQLEMADALDLPLIFHERDSHGRLLEILKGLPNPRRRAVVHCFSGTENELAQYLDMGFFIGITGIVTIKKRGAMLRQMIPSIPNDRILIETDAPYLTPSPQRNKFRRNEPAFVSEVLFKVAEVRETDPHAMADQVWNNTSTLFCIDPAIKEMPVSE
jgi:TatD DNase family protein